MLIFLKLDMNMFARTKAIELEMFVAVVIIKETVHCLLSHSCRVQLSVTSVNFQ